jgi:D-alanyl-D-alanine carboxypeptidase
MPAPRRVPHRALRVLVVLLIAVSVAGVGPAGRAAVAAPAAEVAAAPTAPPGPGKAVRARYAILVDPATGEVLWGRRSRTPVPPASLTKMLTALAVRASLDLDGVTVASKKAAAQPARRLAMKRGQRLTVEQALKALMIVSANDVAVMLA